MKAAHTLGTDTHRPPADESFLAKARALRPFYFIVVVWGRRYTDSLLNFTIRALLSPNNIPALANRGKNKFLIATTTEDWERMQAAPIFRALSEYVEPVFIRIPPCPEDVIACLHMGIGHKLATQQAHQARAYGVLLTPDLMVSDGTMAAIQAHAVSGAKLVVTAALRFAEEPLFAHLHAVRAAPKDSRFGNDVRPLVATGRQLVAAAMRSFHSETLCYEWDAPYFSELPYACWWRVPDEDGIVVHSLSLWPLLMDYAAVANHDTSTMDHWTIDGDYLYRNFDLRKDVHLVQDSDEIMLVSWAPLADRPRPLVARPEFADARTVERVKGELLHRMLFHPNIDALKRRLCMRPVYWHAHDVDHKKWALVEKNAARILRQHGLRIGMVGYTLRVRAKASEFLKVQRLVGVHGVTELREEMALDPRHADNVLLKACHFTVGPLIRGALLLHHYWENRSRVIDLARRAMHGDSSARKRITDALRFTGRRLAGRNLRAAPPHSTDTAARS